MTADLEPTQDARRAFDVRWRDSPFVWAPSADNPHMLRVAQVQTDSIQRAGSFDRQ